MSRDARILIVLAPFIAGLAAMAVVPALGQDQTYHRFADTRARFGVPNFADVASNLPFVLVGTVGLVLLRRVRFADRRERFMWSVFFGAQVLTGLGSAWYHASPDDARLIWDRLPLTGVIMSLVAIVVAERISSSAGRRLLVPLLIVGAGSIGLWSATGDLRLYALVQFGSIASILLAIFLFDSAYPGGAGYGIAIALYAVSKACELADRPIFEATSAAVSGHTLKHLLAGAAGAAILVMVARRHTDARSVERIDGGPAADPGDPTRDAGRAAGRVDNRR